MLSEYCTLSNVAGAVCVLGFVPYVIAIIRKTTKPTISTWFVWAVLDAIILVGMVVKGTENGQIIGSVAGASIVFGLSLWYGTTQWSRMDTLCLVGAAAGIGLWIALGEAAAGILTCCAVVVLGAVPTVVRTWKKPGHEDKLSWVIFTVACLLTLPTIKEFTIEHAAQPISFTIVEVTMLYLVFRRPAQKEPIVEADPSPD